jgi:hypothetical protein
MSRVRSLKRVQLHQRQAGIEHHRVVEEIRAVEAHRRRAVGRGDGDLPETLAQRLHRRLQVMLRAHVAAQAE